MARIEILNWRILAGGCPFTPSEGKGNVKLA
jgi:hypothetical protein